MISLTPARPRLVRGLVWEALHDPLSIHRPYTGGSERQQDRPLLGARLPGVPEQQEEVALLD